MAGTRRVPEENLKRLPGVGKEVPTARFLWEGGGREVCMFKGNIIFKCLTKSNLVMCKLITFSLRTRGNFCKKEQQES